MIRILLPLAFLLSFAAVPFSGAVAQTLITQTPAPADWGQATLLGIGIATPPGWSEVERRDDTVTFFGGDVATRTGPGFTLMFDSNPMQMLKTTLRQPPDLATMRSICWIVTRWHLIAAMSANFSKSTSSKATA